MKTKTASIQQRKTPNVWYPIKDDEACKEAGKYEPLCGEKSISTKFHRTDTAGKIYNFQVKTLKQVS